MADDRSASGSISPKKVYIGPFPPTIFPGLEEDNIANEMNEMENAESPVTESVISPEALEQVNLITQYISFLNLMFQFSTSINPCSAVNSNFHWEIQNFMRREFRQLAQSITPTPAGEITLIPNLLPQIIQDAQRNDIDSNGKILFKYMN
jgi:hypothetical protein